MSLSSLLLAVDPQNIHTVELKKLLCKYYSINDDVENAYYHLLIKNIVGIIDEDWTRLSSQYPIIGEGEKVILKSLTVPKAEYIRNINDDEHIQNIQLAFNKLPSFLLKISKAVESEDVVPSVRKCLENDGLKALIMSAVKIYLTALIRRQLEQHCIETNIFLPASIIESALSEGIESNTSKYVDEFIAGFSGTLQKIKEAIHRFKSAYQIHQIKKELAASQSLVVRLIPTKLNSVVYSEKESEELGIDKLYATMKKRGFRDIPKTEKALATKLRKLVAEGKLKPVKKGERGRGNAGTFYYDDVIKCLSK